MNFILKFLKNNLFISRIRVLLFFILFSFFCFHFVFASDTNGTIDTTFKYAWGQNTGWINFGCDFCNVAVTDTALTGNIWSSEYGWINLNPVLSGVANDAEGTLSGFAWGKNVGWINFTGVTINATGEFLGYATINSDGSNISFNCVNTASCGDSNFKVSTDWRPASVRNPVVPPPSSGSGTSPSPAPAPTPTPPPTPPPFFPPTPPPTPPSVPPTPPPDSNPIIPPTTPPSGPPSPGDGPSSGPSFSPSSILPTVSVFINNVVENVISPVVENIRSVTSKPEVKTLEGVAVTVPVVVSTIILVSSVVSGIPILNYLFYLAVVLAQLLGIKKTPKPWGTIYDSVTKKPIAFARVEILNEQSRKLQSAITDENGRYGFLVSEETVAEGKLELKAFRTRYVFPSKSEPSPVEKELYFNIYRGGPVNISNGISNFDLPMDPLDKPVGHFYPGIVSVKLNKVLSVLADILFIAGAVLGFTNFILTPNKINFIILSVVFFTFLLRISGLKLKPFGVTRDRENNQILPFGFIAIHDTSGKRINFTVSDDKGRYFLLTQKGAFTLRASTPAHILPARTKEIPIFTNKGWISKEIGV
jgi:hypothetical protein